MKALIACIAFNPPEGFRNCHRSPDKASTVMSPEISRYADPTFQRYRKLGRRDNMPLAFETGFCMQASRSFANLVRVCAVSTLIVLAACSTLQPVDLPPETTPPPANAAIWEELAEIRDDDWFALLNDGATALDWRIRAIETATESIDMQTFLWNLDTTGKLVFSHLLEAADRGVSVKLLVDDTFLLGEDQLLIEIAHHENIEYRVFNPYKRRADGFVTRQALNLAEFHRLDHRMHNKALIVDNRVAIVGGRNIADEYFGLHGQANFRDLEVLLGGPTVAKVAQSFDEYWNDHWSFPIEMLGHIDARPVDVETLFQVDSPPMGVFQEAASSTNRELWRTLVENAHSGTATLLVDKPPDKNPALASEAPVQAADALHDVLEQARQEVIAVSAYLIPTPRLERTVAAAVERGVRFRILTNSIRSNNHLTAHSAYRNHIKNLMEQGSELHEVRVDAASRDSYMRAPVQGKNLALHAKVMVVDDDLAFIGSANLDPRSLRINTEMGLLIRSEELNRELRTLLAPDFERANAWELQIDADGDVIWVSDKQVLDSQPAESWLQRLEDWFFAHLPIEGKL